jgi:hypothetical protein
MNGLSERLLVSHYVNNYGGALRRLNAIRARLAALDWARTPVFEINGLKREELVAAGSVILPEVYFESLGGEGDNPPTGVTEPPPGFAQALLQPDRAQASQMLRHVADQLRQKWPKLAAFIDDNETDVLSYFDFPEQHRSKLHNTNPLERLNKSSVAPTSSGSSPTRLRSFG